MTHSVIMDTEFRGNISYNETKQLTLNDWETFENLLQETGYWSMAPSDDTFGMDGSRWIVEAHQKDKYWVVNRWSPRSDFSRIGHYLIDVSGLKERVY
ncbi:hypothetical protein FJM65_00875 [Pontibacter mangrovi]|uniref:Uncharacterized protein n=2 Tax=Pontibacter mangrovi TaxID=2589816 RepID=A0A501WC10_9BACT|nr:hypothetical protein FJM65_00875 [Pontibacter mangrovi]